ncbi:hypothetical protein EFBL_2708 [Effusibacillus lacus]|uniref:Uncharacterized protein n=1 Tax=Effusibacillus lacus TaxID=1348429 RepID=A0A292YM94_9BACL|nr:hypothetical protein EFBL_2708 [Effusibacillus lacus]
MRKISLEELNEKIKQRREQVDYAVNRFRIKSKDEGWTCKRSRPRNTDEIKALNYIARKTFRNELRDGKVLYDKERRVLSIVEYRRSQTPTS